METGSQNGYSGQKVLFTLKAQESEEGKMFGGTSGSAGAIEQAGELAQSKLPFSVGGFGITVIWLFCHGETPAAIGLIVLNIVLRFIPIPFLGLLIGLGIALYYGFKGSQIAVYHSNYTTVEELRKGERGWTIAGAIVLILEIALFALVLL
jgi:hypothetical protein